MDRTPSGPFNRHSPYESLVPSVRVTIWAPNDNLEYDMSRRCCHLSAYAYTRPTQPTGCGSLLGQRVAPVLLDQRERNIGACGHAG